MGNAEITLFTHSGCPGGDSARRFFQEHGVDYVLRDVLQDAEARAEFRRLGGVGTPVLLIGARVIHGFDPEELEHLVSATRGGR